MTQAQTRRFLAAFFAIYFGAVFLRIDYFPLSWVPMYGLHKPREELVVGVGDKGVRKEGFVAYRANGERIRISADALNIPNANFRRLYAQRAFNNAPPQHDRERAALIGFNRWWYETFVGPDPKINRNYPATLLDSINRTFGYAANDPRRIVRLESHMDFAHFNQAQLRSGNIEHPIIERRVAVTTPHGTMMYGAHGSRVIAGYGLTEAKKGVTSVE